MLHPFAHFSLCSINQKVGQIKMIKSKGYLFSLLMLLFLTSCGEKIESYWLDKTLVIDGDASDWDELPLQYNKDMKIVYGIVNNDSEMCMMLRFNDQKVAQMFAVRGFILWANDTDSEKKLYGIHYHDETLRDQFTARMRNRQRQDRQESDDPTFSETPTGTFKLAKNDSLLEILIDDVTGFAAAAGYQEGLYTYEFSMPITTVNGSPYYLDLSRSQSIKVGMEIAGISDQEKAKIKEGMENRRKSDMPSGGGRMPGGGMRGGSKRGGGMRGGEPQMPDMDGEQYWVTVKLATGVK
jgi:hypothetical protein